MVRQVLLLTLVVAGLFSAGAADDGDHGDSTVFGSINDTGVDLRGATTTSPRDPTIDPVTNRGAPSQSPVGTVFIPPPPQGLCPDNLTPCGFTNPADPAAPPVTPDPGAPAVTLADIASFRPTPTPPASEPNGWGIAGLDTNFVADARTQLVTGTLLGRPASVRFTPTSYTWVYGDGATRTTSSPGTTWQRAGVREFDPTPSSHVYAQPGDYTAQLVIGYAAAYSWDGSAFVPIAGTVSVASGSIPVHIVVESTVLVGGGCSAGSTAPGC